MLVIRGNEPTNGFDAFCPESVLAGTALLMPPPWFCTFTNHPKFEIVPQGATLSGPYEFDAKATNPRKEYDQAGRWTFATFAGGGSSGPVLDAPAVVEGYRILAAMPGAYLVSQISADVRFVTGRDDHPGARNNVQPLRRESHTCRRNSAKLLSY